MSTEILMLEFESLERLPLDGQVPACISLLSLGLGYDTISPQIEIVSLMC